MGSAAFRDGKIAHDFLRKLCARVGRKNVILALDTERGQIVVRGWRQRLKLRPADVIPQLEPYCSGFLCTFVDNEGTMKGTDLGVVPKTAAHHKKTDHRGRRHSQPARKFARSKKSACTQPSAWRSI